MKRGRISWLLSAALLLGATAATAQPLPCASVSPEAREYVRSRGACRDVKPAPRPRKSTQPKAGTSGSPPSAQQNPVVPQVSGRSHADNAPAGEAPAQEPAPAALGRPGSTVTLQVSDGSLAGAAGTTPVAAPVTAAAAASAPAPATSLAPVPTAVPLLPQEPIDAPGARGQFPAALSANAALIFGAGVALGLLSGALLMRQRLLRGQLKVGASAPQPTLLLPQRQQPVDQELADLALGDQQPVDQQPVEQLSIDGQPVDPPPAESDAGGVPETSAPPEIQFAAWLVPVTTTIVLAPRRATDGIHTSIRATTTYEQVRLLAPIEVSGDDIERALIEQSRDDSAVARILERLHGAAAERAANELNRALDIDILDVLAQGWVQVPAMNGAVQLSAVTRGPPVLVKVDVPHSIASTSHLMLDTRVAGNSLPPLEMALEIVADVQRATLAARDGRIDLVALGEATVLARLKYKSVLVKEHATEITGTLRDSLEPRPPATERPASIDFPL